MKYFETEVVHGVFDDLTLTELTCMFHYKCNILYWTPLSMFHYECLLRAVQCSVHSGNNYLFLLMTLRAFLILETKLRPTCPTLHMGAVLDPATVSHKTQNIALMMALWG
uniref:Uncharacterized protein n=1 Tax=Equus asinus TaxID=9793 RepID=A0A8C4M1F9_EQUAS